MNEDPPPDGIAGAVPLGANVQKIPVDPACKEQALEKIRAAVKGNGFDPENVNIDSFDGEVLKFTAQTLLEIRTKTSEKTVAGRQNAGQTVDSPVALKTAIEQETQKLFESVDTTRKIREVVLNRDDKGFAQDNVIIPVNFWKKDFVHYEGCTTCKTNGTIQCKRCHGIGREPCPQCDKKGVTLCPQCNGSTNIQGPNGQQQCPQCHGQGDITCSLCQQRREVQCRTCKTKGSTTCTACNGHGWNSHIVIVEMDVRTHFDYDREAVPEKVERLMERLGPKLDQHAKIEVSQPKEQGGQKHEDHDQEEKQIAIHYNVELPYGHIEFLVGDEKAYAFLFGHQVKLTYVSPFLEPLIANGARKLRDAAEENGSVAENLQAAAKYKTVRQAIIAAARYPLAKAAKAVQSGSPLGVSKEKIGEMVQNADHALKNITRKPRIQGLIGGLGLGALFYGVWFFMLRASLLASVTNEIAQMAADLMIYGLGAMLVVFAIQMMSGNALRTALKNIVPPGKEKAFTPKTGKMGLYAAIGAFVIFAVLWVSTFLGA